MKITRLSPKPKTGPTTDVVALKILTNATETTERNPDLPSHQWVTKDGKTLNTFNEGLWLALDGRIPKAIGLWALAAEAAVYARLLSKTEREKEDAVMQMMLRIHRRLYHRALALYDAPFVGLTHKRTLRVMIDVLQEMKG